ncbi:MAG TPA: GWxTD domain-containing protein, partial [Pyrinomonadaceae bacterium]
MFATRIILIFSALVVTVNISAQPATKSSDPQDKPRKVRPEPHKAFKQWLQEVEPIIRPEELNAWNKLRNDEEREQFILEFWRLRDTDRDTEENEYREAYFERFAYVNEHFTAGIPGYKTDRGKIYLKYGKPDEIESHPSGGSYQPPSHERFNATSTYPFEKWWYRHIPGHNDVEIEFVDPAGTGEYRIARNPFEKIATLHMPGGVSIPGVNQADIISAASGFGNPFSSRAKDSGFEWMELLRIRDEAPSVNFDRDRGTGTSTPVTDDNFLTSNLQISFFRQSDDRVIVAFTVQADNRDLVFREVGGLQTARLNIAGRIMNVSGRRVGFFEDAVTTTATSAELINAKERKSAYQKALPMLPGRYRIDLLVRDVESGAAGIQHVGFQVPKFGKDLAASSLVLASVLANVSDVPASRQFVIGDKKVIPNLTATYRRGSPIGVYMQIYNAGVDQATLRPSVDVEYALIKDGKEIGKQTEDWRGNSDSGQRLTLARLVDSRGLNPGDYLIEVR